MKLEKINTKIIKKTSGIFFPILIGLILAGLFSATLFAFATPPASTYTPGETLEPNCSPVVGNPNYKANCTTTAPLTSESDPTYITWYNSGNPTLTGLTTATETINSASSGGYGPAIYWSRQNVTKWYQQIDSLNEGTNQMDFDNASGTPVLSLLQNGNVGIGTASPGQKLDIVGNMKTSGNLYIGTGGDYIATTQSGYVKLFPSQGTDPAFYVQDPNTAGRSIMMGYRGASGAFLQYGSNYSALRVEQFGGSLGNISANDIDITGSYKINGTPIGASAWLYDSGLNYNMRSVDAGNGTMTGDENFMVGWHAGLANTSGDFNNFLGYQAGLANTTGNDNNFLGYLAGASNITGSNNNFMGYQAGFSNITGTDNNFFGWKAGYSNTVGVYNIAIGNKAGYSNGGDWNLFIGGGAGQSNVTGSNDIFIGTNAGYDQTGSNIFMVDQQANLRHSAAGERENSLLYGTFGADASAQMLTINADEVKLPYLPGGGGSANVYWDSGTGTLYQASSSLRYKTDVQPLVDDFSKIYQIQPKTFKYKSTGTEDLGYIAEEFDALGLNRLVNYDKLGRPDSLKYDRITLYLTEVIKQQKIDIDSLKLVAGLNASGYAGNGTVAGVDTTNTLMSGVSQLLANVGITIENGITSIKNLVVDNLTVKTAKITGGMEMVDKATGEVYCTWVQGGEWQKQKGDCASVFASLPVIVASANGPETANIPTTQDQITATTKVVQEAVKVVQQAAQQQDEPVQQAQQAAEQAQRAAEQAQQAVQQVQQQVQQTPETPAPVIEAPAVPEVQNPEPEVAPVETTPQNTEPGVGDLIKDAASGLLDGVIRMVKDFFNISISGLKSLSFGLKSSVASLSNSVNSNSINTKENVKNISNKATNNIKIFGSAISAPLQDAFGFVMSKIK